MSTRSPFPGLLASALLAAAALGLSACSYATSPATGRQFLTPVSESDEAKLGAEEHPKILTADAMAVRPLIDALPTRERRILIMRFFESKTQNQIAEKLQISQMHVSRILPRTLKSLRQQALCEPQPT